jgi:hypothetical protein
MSPLVAARAWLEVNVHPIAPWALLTVLIFLSVYASRKFCPKLWLWFDLVTPDGAVGHAVQGLPSVALGALAAAFTAGPGNYGFVWCGLVSGALAPILHLLMKWAPFIPYQGAIAQIAKSVGIVAIVLLAFSGCGVPAKTVVQDTCTILDSGNPLIGAICLTAEEKASVVRHAKASRSARSKKAGAAPGAEVDICEAP